MVKLVKACFVALVGLCAARSSAEPITAEQAAYAVRAWTASGETLGTQFGSKVLSAEKITTNGVSFHAVQLDAGTVFTSADTESEPIIAFTSSTEVDLSPESPMFMILQRDAYVRAKIANDSRTASASVAAARTASAASAASRWGDLIASGQAMEKNDGKTYGVNTVSDIRVDPMTRTEWNQSTVNGRNCYNYYTPEVRYSPSYYDTVRSLCGCSATALAQVIRYWSYPVSAMPQRDYTCIVRTYSGSSSYGYYQTLRTMAGTYRWDLMTEKPAKTSAMTDANYRAIGHLTYDCAVALMSDFSANSTGAYPSDQAPALKNAFGYSSAQYYFDWDALNYSQDKHQRAVYAPIDAGAPVMLAIYRVYDGSVYGGHCVVGDGYGYATVSGVKTPYVHLNLGWGGSSDMWYNLPDVDTAGFGSKTGNYNVFGGVIYNIFPTNTGEVVSGRILDAAGAPVAGASVRIYESGSDVVRQSKTSSSHGVYAFIVPSGKRYDIEAEASNGDFGFITTATVPASRSGSIGNSWGNEIVLQRAANRPDLTVSRCFLSLLGGTNVSESAATTSFEMGQPVYCHLSVKNNGGSAVDSSFDVSHELINADGDVVASSSETVSVPMGVSDALSWNGLSLNFMQGLPSGDYTYRFAVDVGNSIRESDEQNNCSTFNFRVADRQEIPANLSISGPSSINAGDRASYICKVTYGDGTVRTVDPTWSISSGAAYATVDATGLVTAGLHPESHTILLRANYVQNGVSKTATQTVAILPTIPLPVALDNDDLTFSTGSGNVQWYGQPSQTKDGVDAGRSGPVGDGGTAWMESSATGPGTLSFWYKVDSEANYDKLEFLIDGEVRLSESGVGGEWKHYDVSVPAGIHVFRWRYVKDGSYSSGLDAAFVDEVMWQRIPTPVSLSITGVGELTAGESSQYACSVTMSDGTVKTVSPVWSLSAGSSYATMSDTGVLASAVSDNDRSVTIAAEYTESGITRSASKNVRIIGILPPPVAPEIITYGAGDADAAHISWTAGQYADSYNVYRSRTSVRPDQPLATGLISRSYADPTVDPGVGYNYWVSAVNAKGEAVSEEREAYRVASISVTPPSFDTSHEAASLSASVSANANWSVEIDEESTWVTSNVASGGGHGSFSLAVEANQGENNRFAIVYVTAAPDTEHPVTVPVRVVQEGKPYEKPGVPDYAFRLIDGGDAEHVMYAVENEQACAGRIFEYGNEFFAKFGWINNGTGTNVSEIVHSIAFDDIDGTTVRADTVSVDGTVPTNTPRVVVYGVEGWKELSPGPYVMSSILNSERYYEEPNPNDNSAEYRFAVRDMLTLSETFGDYDLGFQSNDDEWFGSRGIGPDGASGVMTKHLGHGGTNTLTASVTGSGILKFAYRVSADYSEKFIFTADGEVKASMSGLMGWRNVSVELGGEEDEVHELKWMYCRDSANICHADCAIVSNLEWLPEIHVVPTNVVATDRDYYSSLFVKITWDKCPGAESYVVARSEDGETWEDIGSSVKLWLNDTTALGGVAYLYRVKAVFPNGESDWSEPDEGMLPPSLRISGSTKVTVPGTASSIAFPVVGNSAWTANSDSDWLVLSETSGIGDGKIVVRYGANSGDVREGTITVSSVGFDADVKLKVTQVKAVEFGDVVDLNEAADCHNVIFQTSGAVGWCGQSRISHDGSDALRSGAIQKSTNSVLTATFGSAGTLSFWWGTCCEKWDKIVLYINGVETNSLSGYNTATDPVAKTNVVNWTHVTLDIPVGGAVVTWEYKKDYSGDKWEDAVFVDQIVWTPHEVTPDIPAEWWSKYPGLLERLGVSDYATAAKMQSPGSVGSSGKFKSDGSILKVWEDYVAGTDPLDSDSRFMAMISFDEHGLPVVEWLPVMSPAEMSMRNYIIYGSQELGAEWEPVPDGGEPDYRFFKVTVEMK